MDSIKKEYERKVSSDPSNHDFVAKLYHYQERLGIKTKEDLVERNCSLRQELDRELHNYFQVNPRFNYTRILFWTETDWGFWSDSYCGRIREKIQFVYAHDYHDFEKFWQENDFSSLGKDFCIGSMIYHTITDAYDSEEELICYYEKDDYVLVYSEDRSYSEIGRIFKKSNQLDFVKYHKEVLRRLNNES